MDQIGTSGSDSDLDIDLESGGTTSEEDAIKVQGLSSEPSYGSMNDRDNNKLSNFNEIYYKNKEMQLVKFREETENSVDKKRHKKQNSKRPPKPPRHPRAPSLGTSDIKLLKEISELNSRRRRMETRRALKNIKKDKPSSLNSNLFAFLVTIIFFLVIILQGHLCSRV